MSSSASSGPLDISRRELDPGGIEPHQEEYEKELYKNLRDVKGMVRRRVGKRNWLNLPLADDDNIESVKEDFLDWFREKLEQKMPPDGFDRHVDRGYAKGLIHADQELRGLGVEPSDADPRVVDESGSDAITRLPMVMNRPVHSRHRDALKGRNKRALRKIIEVLVADVSFQLDQGLRNQWTKRQVADEINRVITKVGIDRARTHARTIVIQAHADATIKRWQEIIGTSAPSSGAYEAQQPAEGQEPKPEIEIEAELVTALDEKVCEKCAPHDGRRMSIEKAEHRIPFHPNCRCVYHLVEKTPSFSFSDENFEEGATGGDIITKEGFEVLKDSIREKHEVSRNTWNDVEWDLSMWKEDSGTVDMVEFGKELKEVVENGASTERERAIQGIVEASQEYVRQRHGEEITVYRGLRWQEWDAIAQEEARSPGSDITILQRDAANYTTDPRTATMFGDVIKETRSVEDVMMATDPLFYRVSYFDEGEIVFAGGERVLEAGKYELLAADEIMV